MREQRQWVTAMMRTLASRLSHHKKHEANERVGVGCLWTIKEKDPTTGLYVPVLQKWNKLTSSGLSNLAAAWGVGTFVLPQYLIIDTNYGSLVSALSSTGLTSFQLTARIDIAGDTQVVLGAGTTNQETVTFSSVTGTGPYTYNLSTPTTKTHLVTDPVLRQVNQNDTLSNSVVAELQYDATNDPNHRAVASAGYSQGIGNWTVQFFLTGTQAIGNLMTLGLSETQTVGIGILHNHCILGYYHSLAAMQDIEIDASLTLVNN
jgi:hypothetical protein